MWGGRKGGREGGCLCLDRWQWESSTDVCGGGFGEKEGEGEGGGSFGNTEAGNRSDEPTGAKVDFDKLTLITASEGTGTLEDHQISYLHIFSFTRSGLF